MTSRAIYYVSATTGDVTRTLWDVALDYLRPQLYEARIDLFPDLNRKEPSVEFRAEDIAAYKFLRDALAPASKRGRRTWMDERLDLSNPEIFLSYKTYGYHSIQTSAYRRDEPPERAEHPEAVAAIDNHDQGHTIGVRLTEAELAELRSLLEAKCWPLEKLAVREPRSKKRWFWRR